MTAAEGTVLAAGAVLWRPVTDAGELAADAGAVEVAVVHRPRYDDWSLPKGKLGPEETIPVAAVREVAEETGFAAKLGRRLGTVEYPAPAPIGWLKRVEYFSARADNGRFHPNSEVDELRWLRVPAAVEIMTRPADRDILAKFAVLPPALHALLLVRHAKAGRKSDWRHDDALRPLSSAGKRQAAALRSMLPMFGVERVYSAPRVRCVQTIEGVAADLGVEIGAEPSLSEEGYWNNEEAALARLLRIADQHGASLVCSQGGVIPDLVRRLGDRSRLALGEVVSKKASVWALFFLRSERGPVMVAADYHRTAFPAPDAQASDRSTGN